VPWLVRLEKTILRRKQCPPKKNRPLKATGVKI
jgi:hypothetical protein